MSAATTRSQAESRTMIANQTTCASPPAPTAHTTWAEGTATPAPPIPCTHEPVYNLVRSSFYLIPISEIELQKPIKLPNNNPND